MLKQNRKHKKWSKEDEQFIKENYKTMTVSEIASYFNVSQKAARGKIERLGLDLKSLNRGLAAVWNEEDVEYLKENWMEKQDIEIAIYLGLERGFTKEVVFRKRKSMGLMGKSKRVRTEKQTGYKYHIEYDKKVYSHRLNMEKEIGRKLLKTEIVHHIDCDKTNDDINNLLICSASEHKLLHLQLEHISRELYRQGLITFDFESRQYVLNMPTRTEG